MGKSNLPQGRGDWKNRIVGHDEVAPDQLLAHPHNFRIHPAPQQSALAGSLDGLGWIQEVIVNRTTGHMIDGHLRVALAMRSGAATVPVAYVELSEEEEAQALLSLDPIAAMAATDKDNMDALLREIQTDDERVSEFLAELAAQNGIIPVDDNDWSDAFGKLPDEDRAPFQQMTFTLHDTQAEIVKDAISKAKAIGDFSGSMNENSNGNALAFICEAFGNGIG